MKLRYLATVAMLFCSLAFAQSYLLPWNSINSGGAVLAGAGASRLSSTAAQPVQGTGTSPDYDGYWGFWYDLVRRDVDVGVLAILTPIDQVDTLPLTPRAVVMNYGPNEEPSVTVCFQILEGGIEQYADTATVTDVLPNGGVATATFAAYGGHHDTGAYVTRCWTSVADDQNHSNDLRTGTFTVTYNPPGSSVWISKVALPPGGKSKNIKDGGCLAYGQENTDANDTGYVYAFKGNSTCEFYRYNTATNVWITRDSIPAIGRSLKKKAVKKGGALAMGGDGKVYGAKGNNTYEFWCYDPVRPVLQHWAQLNDFPNGARPCKEGASLAAVTVGGTNYMYFLKGSGTCEFYRYNADNRTWATMTDAPSGTSGKPYKDGSSIAYDGGDTIYCLKGSYNEFAAYSISNRNWVTLAPLPMIVPPGTKKTKVKAGSHIAVAGRTVYALKGSNTNEFWMYPFDSPHWSHGTDMPVGSKRVNGGGALVYGGSMHALYALRGNNTLEFWMYSSVALRGMDLEPKYDVMGNRQLLGNCGLAVAPNPFAGKTRISYTLPKAGNVSLKLYDVTGALVTTLVRGYTPAGTRNTLLTSGKLAHGIYLLKFESEGYATTSKLIVE